MRPRHNVCGGHWELEPSIMWRHNYGLCCTSKVQWLGVLPCRLHTWLLALSHTSHMRTLSYHLQMTFKTKMQTNSYLRHTGVAYSSMLQLAKVQCVHFFFSLLPKFKKKCTCKLNCILTLFRSVPGTWQNTIFFPTKTKMGFPLLGTLIHCSAEYVSMSLKYL